MAALVFATFLASQPVFPASDINDYIKSPVALPDGRLGGCHPGIQALGLMGWREGYNPVGQPGLTGILRRCGSFAVQDDVLYFPVSDS